MAQKASDANVIFRPHFKTHQSHEIGRWFRDEGVSKITCSSLSMAEYFAEDGWNDITVAFPVNVLEIDTINRLASTTQLNLVFESIESVELLSAKLAASVSALIKLDIGTHRTGIDPKDHQKIEAVIEAISSSKNLIFLGFLSHAGHSYACRGKDEIMEVHKDCMQTLSELKGRFPKTFISYGDTPTCSVADSFEPCDEIRPGNFCFYDLMQLQIDACSEHEISAALACPIVAKHPERNEVVIYGGGVHFSKDRMEESGKTIFGKVVEDQGEKWKSIIPNVILARVSQEHGIIQAPNDWIDQIKIGDIVKVLPVHSCMTMDLLRSFQKV